MKGTDEITNYQDVIDSRDVIARIEYLQSEFDSRKGHVTDAETDEEKAEAREKLADWLGYPIDELPADPEEIELKDCTSDEATELRNLLALAEQGEGYGDWSYGEALIRESHFEDYARELAEDIGAIPDDAKWPCNCIDWEQAARELKMDYTTLDFDGVEYLMRS